MDIAELCNSLSHFEIRHRLDEARDRLTEAKRDLTDARKAFAKADTTSIAATENLLDLHHPEWREELCKAASTHAEGCTNAECKRKVTSAGDPKPTRGNNRRLKRAHAAAIANYEVREEKLLRAELEVEAALRSLRSAEETLEVKEEMMRDGKY